MNVSKDGDAGDIVLYMFFGSQRAKVMASVSTRFCLSLSLPVKSVFVVVAVLDCCCLFIALALVIVAPFLVLVVCGRRSRRR